MDTLGYKNPVFFLFALSIAAEAWIIIRWHRSTFPWKESLVSLFIALGGRGASAVSAIPIWFTATWIYEHRIASFDLTHWYEWVILFVGHEFCYYWHHRAAHRCRWVWATHRVHHTPEHLTFSGAYRLAWTSLLSGIFLFFMPLVWLGFPPMAGSVKVMMTGEKAIAGVLDLPIAKHAGGALKLTDLRGKIIVLDFWGTFCPPCLKQVPQLVALNKKYKDKGLEIVGLSMDDKQTDQKLVNDFIKQSFVRLFERREFAAARVDEKNVNFAEFFARLDK